MSLYTGFNALGLGQAVGSNDAQRRQNGKDLIELLRNFGNSAAERYDENRRKKALMETAARLGIDDAEGLSDGLSGEDFARYVYGIASAKESEKITDARQKKQWGHDELVRSDERRYNEGQEANKREREALDKGFATLSQAYIADTTKMRDNLLPSQSDIDESARIRNDLMEFVKKHPEYGLQLTMNLMEGDKGNSKPVKTLESRFSDLDAVVKDGVVDPKAMQELKERLIAENVWAALNENKDFQAKWNLYAGKIAGDKIARDALMLGSGDRKTEGDAQKALDDRERQKKITAELKAMRAAYKAKKPFDFKTLKDLGWYGENVNSAKYKNIIKAIENGYKAGI